MVQFCRVAFNLNRPDDSSRAACQGAAFSRHYRSCAHLDVAGMARLLPSALLRSYLNMRLLVDERAYAPTWSHHFLTCGIPPAPCSICRHRALKAGSCIKSFRVRRAPVSAVAL